jgi:hypothetical protein
MPVTKMPDELWISFPTWARFDATDVANVLQDPKKRPQPTYPIINSTLDDLVTALTQYATKQPPDVAPELQKIFATNVQLEDKTSRRLLGGDAQLAQTALADQIVARGFTLFGCYYQTSNDVNDQGVDGATSEFLAFSAPPDKSAPTMEGGLVLRPLFDQDRKIATLIATQNRAWMLSALNGRSYDCNGFSVKKPLS